MVRKVLYVVFKTRTTARNRRVGRRGPSNRTVRGDNILKKRPTTMKLSQIKVVIRVVILNIIKCEFKMSGR